MPISREAKGMQMKTINTYATFVILFFISGCAVLLTKDGSKVGIAKLEAIRPFCQVVQRITISDNANIARNMAARIGANYVATEWKPNIADVNVVMVKCPPLVEMTSDEVKHKCQTNDSEACIELAYRSQNNDVLKYLKQACSLENEMGCQLVTRVKDNQQKEQRVTRAIKGCDLGRSQDCLIVASVYNQNGHYDAAISMAERACTHGNKEGCLMQSNYSSQKQQREQVLLQTIMLQQQNTANVIAQQQLINSAASQTQNLILQNMQLQQSRQSQSSPVPQTINHPSVFPATTNCRGRINQSGRFSATCN